MINIFGLEDGFPSQLQGTKLKSFVQNSVGKKYEINNYVLILCSTNYFSRYPVTSFRPWSDRSNQ